MNPFAWSESQIFGFFFVLVRVTSLMIFLPIFGDRAIPPTVKVLFGVALAFVTYPMLAAQGVGISSDIMNNNMKVMWAVACEIGFGMIVAFVARWIFDAVQLAGYFAGTSIGFSMASVLDPHTETQTIAFAELQYLLAALLFLAMDGHHLYLSAIMQSFKVVPLGAANLTANGDSIVQYLIHMTSEVLSLGLKLSGPVVVVALIINLTFGVLSRAVPQMNVMVISFAANILVGVFVVIVSLPGFINMVGGAFDAFTPELVKFMRLFHG